MSEPSDAGYLLNKASIAALRDDHRRLKSLFAAFAARMGTDGKIDLVCFHWVDIPEELAPGDHTLMYIVIHGEVTEDQIDVYNRWPNTTAQAGSRWLAVYADGEWALAPGECAP